MKRFAAILLILILVLSLCACGKKHVEEGPAAPGVEEHTDEEKKPNKPVPEVTKPEDTEEPVTDGKTAPIPAGKPTEKTDDSSSSGGGYHGGGGHHSGGKDTPTVQNLTITEEKTITNGEYNDVIISADVGNGTVTLNGVKINGKLIVRGGGSNSIKVNNCNVGTVVMQKDTSGGGEAPRLELTGTAVNTVEVTKPAIIEATDAVSKVNDLSAKDDVTIKGEKTEIASVIVPTEAKENVKLTVNDAAVTTVMAEAPVVIETNAAAGKTPVAAVEAKADVTVSGAATNVGTVTVPADAGENVTLKVESAKVAAVSAEAPVTIQADETAARIDSVEVKDDVTVVGENTKIGTITVLDNPNKDEVPIINVSEGSVNTVKAESAASVSGGSNAIANVEAAAPVTVDSDAVTKVTVTVNVTVTVSGNGQIEVKVDTTSDVEIKATSTQNLSVSTTQTVTNNITVKQGEATQTVHIHKWVESNREEATCTRTGSITYTCSEPNCDAENHQKTETIPAKGHTEVVIPAVDPTCTAAGHTAGKKCAVCSTEKEIVYIVEPEPISALGHDFTGSLVSDETGHWHVCPRCGETDTKHTHTYSTTNCTVAARCTECGYQKAAGVHTWNAGTVQAAASCDTAGSMLYTCTSCSATKTETIPALGHTYGAPVFNWNDTGTNCTAERTCTRDGCNHTDSAVAQISSYKLKNPTCTEPGVTVYTAAVVFDGKTYSGTTDVTVRATGHNYGTPTYTWDGDQCTATRVCGNDGNHKETETVTATKIVTQSKTCTLDELSTYTATFANSAFEAQTQTNVKTADKLGHSLTKTETEAATCEKAGNNDYWTCSRCEKVFSDAQGVTETTVKDRTIAALGHDWVDAWSTDGTYHWHVCSRTGCVAVDAKAEHTPGAAATETVAQTCTVCGYELAPATGHLCVNHLTEHAATAATCTTAGNSAYWSCTCGKYYSDANAEHEVEKDSWVLSVIAHTFNQEKAEETYLKDAATCTAKAVYYKSCTCGAKGTETFEYGSALGHSFTNYVSDNNATCTADGTKTAKCDRCDVTDTVADTDSKLGHSFTTKASAVKLSDATCTAKAVYKVQCDRCDAVSDSVTVQVGEVNLNNHDYGAPTYKWNGTQCTAERVCTRDANHKETETVDGVYTVVTEPTYTTAGSAVYKVTFTNTAFAGQTSEAVTIPATPFKVGENTYATYEEALDAAQEAGLKDEKLFDLTYKVYPTIEIYGSCTVEGNLHLATATSIAVKNGGSLTVGSLTLDESTMNGWWLDAGTLRLEQGSSFRLGGVQYTGTNGAFAMDAMDNDESYIELAGRAPDMGGNDYVTVFNGNITQQNTFTMGSSYMFFNEQNSVLTVKGTLTNNAYVDNRGTIVIDGGILTNKATIDNESGIIPDAVGGINIKNKGTLTNEAGANITGGNIDAFGSTVTNAGTIRVGDNCALVIENGSILNNTGTLNGGQGSELDDGEYVYATATTTNILNGVENVPVTKVAAVFDVTKLQAALDTYDYVVPCGTSTTGTNTVTLGNLTVPKGKLLILKETVNDGTNQYHNKFVLGKIEIQRDPAEKDPHNGNLVTVGNPNVTVNGRIDAYGFIAFDTLTIANGGYVYVENEMMIVDKALTIAEGGTLEIGSGSQMYYRGENNATIDGTLKATVRNVNGFVNQVRSDIQGKGMTPNATMTTLVITEDTILHGEHTVDTVIPIQYKDDDDHIVAPTLRVGANSSLKFKELYTDEGGTKAQIIGCSENKGEDGYYTVSPNASSAVEVASATDFLAALDDPEVTDITITENITLTYADNLWNHPITKAVTVAKGVKLEIKPYDGSIEPGMKFNGIMIAANGSLTLEDGVAGFNKAILKTGTYHSGANEPWYEYRSQVNVNGGILDASQGKLETDSTGNIDFEVGNGELKLPNTVDNYLITYTVDSKEELLSTNDANDPCNNILLKSDVVLTEDYTVNKVLTVMNDEEHMYRLTVGSGKTLTVPKNVTLYVNGEVRVEGTLINNGTIVGEGMIDIMGGTLNNGGMIDLNGESNDLAVEKGGILNNFVGEVSGKITKNTHIDFCDYWYDDAEPLCCDWNVLPGDTTLDGMGQNITVMAAAFSPEKVEAALATTTSWGEGPNNVNTVNKYGVVVASGTAEENGEVTLSGITVNPYQTLLLKDYVDVGDKTYHNAVYNLSDITFKQNACMVIKGDPTINVTGALDYSRVKVNGNPTINAPGFVHNAEELEAALQNGGDIYLYPFDRDDIKPVIFRYEDGRTEEVYETQYWIDTTAIATNTNLNKMGGEDPMAVFFKNGFTVNEGVTLQLHDLNVVAAANSTVGGRVEVCNGILVVQANSQNGATLTIEESGLVQIGNPDCDGKLAIFPKDGYINNKIVNNGRIESFGELKFDRNRERENPQFEGNDPIEYATFRDLVCELQQGFGNMPNLQQINFEEKNEFGPEDLRWLYEIYPADGQELERNEDYDAIGAFAWLIKNDVISNTPVSGMKLNPWHYMTYNEVSGLFNKFATKVLGTATDLEIATGTDLADKNPCFGKLHDALGGLSRAEVSDEQALREALDAPYVTEIHIKGNIQLSTRTDLQPAGEHDDQHRAIFVEPNFTLTVPKDIQMDIKQNVKLVIVCDDNRTENDEDDTRGMLIVKGNVNVFGDLEPDENDESRIIVDREHGGNISYFGDANFFGEKLLEVAGEYMSQKDEIPAGYDQIDGWDDDEKVTCLVAYGLEPEGDENGSWWNFGRALEYREIKTILTNIYKKALATTSDLPGSVAVGDEQWPNENDILDNRNMEELLSRFALVLPKREDATTNSFVIQRTNNENNTDGKTIIGKTFTNAITVTAVKTNDNFAGELNFVNCTFSGGITLVYNLECDYRVNFNDSCTGAVTTDYPEGITSGDRRIRIAHPNGITITANALTAFEMNDGCLCSTDSFTVNGLTINSNGCENLEVDVRRDDTIPTIDVTGSENGNAIKLSGSYTGKLRVSGCIDVSRVALGTNSWIELANWHDTTNGDCAPNSSIALGGNDISINDDWGEHSFTGSGTIHVNGDPKANLQLTVNDRNLANPHVFGDVPDCTVFLGLANVENVSFSLKQGTWDDENKCVSSWTDIPQGSFAAVYYNESGKVTAENPDPTKTHLERVEGASGWITDPHQVNLTVTVKGCTVVYDKLWYKDAQVVDQGQTG